jgi:hypothetical protein
VADGSAVIHRQLEIIAELQRDGLDTTLARTVLDGFRETYALDLGMTNRLLQMLAAYPY